MKRKKIIKKLKKMRDKCKASQSKQIVFSKPWRFFDGLISGYEDSIYLLERS